jgi:hypothetical protein
VLTIADIPDRYRKGDSDGDNVARLASGVQSAMHGAIGENGSQALRRFVQAGFHFRSSEIGLQMVNASGPLSEPLSETPQLVSFAGSSLAATSYVAALDLTAAAMYRLHHGTLDANDPGREADLMSYPLAAGPPEVTTWVAECRGAHAWAVLRAVRDQFAHRWFPLHVTVVLGGPPGAFHHLEIAGQRKHVFEFLIESRAFVIDRLVAAGLLMDRFAFHSAG